MRGYIGDGGAGRARRPSRRPPTGRREPPSTLKLSDWEFEQYVQAEVDGEATPEQLAVLEADRVSWRAALRQLARATPRSTSRVPGPCAATSASR